MEGFDQQIAAIKSAIQATSRIAGGSSADTIDVNSLSPDLSALANRAFTGPVLTAGQKIARRDAYDFASACVRAVEHFKMDRAQYYSSAVDAAAVLTERLDYVNAGMNLFEAIKPRAK